MASICKLSISTICNYVDGNERTRNLREGEAVIDAGHVICCGVTERGPPTLSFMALCMQTSALSSVPHTITGQLHYAGTHYEIGMVTCSCKAGNSHQCKHCVAALLFINRNSGVLEDLSCTDTKCMWAARKEDCLLGYKAIPIKEFCHVTPTAPFPEAPLKDIMDGILNGLLQAAPESGLAKSRSGRPALACMQVPLLTSSTTQIEVMSECHSVYTIVKDKLQQSIECHSNYFVSTGAAARIKLNPIDFVPSLPAPLGHFYHTEICVSVTQALQIASKAQGSSVWANERAKRITGTYLHKVLRSTNPSNTAVRKLQSHKKRVVCKQFTYGFQNEFQAIRDFTSESGMKVDRCGLIIHPQQPFLGVSPDGLVHSANGIAVLEVKCPYTARNKTLLEAVGCKEIKYLKVVEGKLELIKNDCMGYYAQVNLAMYILDCHEAFFVIWSPVETAPVILTIRRDDCFLRQAIPKAREFFFNTYLPLLYHDVVANKQTDI